jgi:hypothetical protein
MTKPQLQKHAKSLDWSNAWFWMVGKGIHGIHVLQQAGLDVVWYEENLARPNQLLSQFK